ncbi:cysteine methyltransferase [Candidatus Pacearchaeota archaeon]|jgi:methylated-DNA-[protein]-cysteine S-methyltransferase|nr:cysteine methyltransferase [Candidatus Pacearchaeota archaeon]|tara:strand:+ start:1731 stop:2006 length:276 start_codon:yes stop_codon:yes gene_type:complete
MQTKFQERVYKIIKKIPKGKVTTYSIIAKKLKTSPRAVGKALNANKNLIKIPCHRVVMSDMKLGGYKLGVKKKIELLKKEGVQIIDNKIVL